MSLSTLSSTRRAAPQQQRDRTGAAAGPGTGAERSRAGAAAAQTAVRLHNTDTSPAAHLPLTPQAPLRAGAPRATSIPYLTLRLKPRLPAEPAPAGKRGRAGERRPRWRSGAAAEQRPRWRLARPQRSQSPPAGSRRHIIAAGGPRANRRLLGPRHAGSIPPTRARTSRPAAPAHDVTPLHVAAQNPGLYKL